MFYHSSRFRKQFKKFPEKIKTRAIRCLEILSMNEFEESLGNHKLSGEYVDCRSIDITGDIRIAYKRMGTGFYLVAMGTHSELYR